MQAKDARCIAECLGQPAGSAGDSDIPHVSLEMPTGSGKTLVAGHAVGRINAALDRRRTGLGAVDRAERRDLSPDARPVSAIGGSGVRVALETASGRGGEDIAEGDGFTAADVETQLCVMLLMLQSTGRKDKETLKVFRDSAAYAASFRRWTTCGADRAQAAVAQSGRLYDVRIGVPRPWWRRASNTARHVLRVTRPIIVPDEGHRAYSQTARSDAGGMKPALPDQLTATPDRAHSNILVNVNGRTRADDRWLSYRSSCSPMRKSSWQDTLARRCERAARGAGAGRQVERHGGEGRHIRRFCWFGSSAREGSARRRAYPYRGRLRELTQRLAGRPSDQAADRDRQGAENDDLMAERLPSRVIITRTRCVEGWDARSPISSRACPRGRRRPRLTQMIGRVMRMPPHVTYTGIRYSIARTSSATTWDVKEAVARIKKGLEEEGMGDIAGSAVSPKGRRRSRAHRARAAGGVSATLASWCPA
jgi:type III restriction enzyme